MQQFDSIQKEGPARPLNYRDRKEVMELYTNGMKTLSAALLFVLLVSTAVAGQDWVATSNAYALPEEVFDVYVGDLDPEHLVDAQWSAKEGVSGEVLDRAAVYWLRYIVTEPKEYGDDGEQIEEPVFVVESYATPVRLYVDGIPIPEPTTHPLFRLDYTVYDQLAVEPGDTVYFRVESNPYAGEEIYLVDRENLVSGRSRFRLFYLYAEIPMLAFAFLAVLVGLGVLGIAAARHRRADRFLLWFGLFALSYAAYTIFEGNVVNVLFEIDPIIDFYVPLLALDLMPLLLLLFYVSFARGSWKAIFTVLALGQTAVLLLRLAVMVSGQFSEWADKLSLFYPMVLYTAVVANLVVAQRRNPFAPLFGLAFFIFGATYAMQFVGESYDLFDDLPIMIGPMAFFLVLSAVPIYSYFRQQAHIAAQNVAFARFVPREFLSLLGREEVTDVSLGDQVERDLTILFSDIRSFTTISESMTPEENVSFLNRYLAAMVPIVRDHNGFVDKYIGDAVMAIFPGQPADAVRCAIAMVQRVEELNAEFADRERPSLRIGVGIHTGRTMLGVVGETGRYQGTVISDAVNLASRLEELTKKTDTSILFSGTTAASLTDAIPLRHIGVTRVKGKSKPTHVYTVRQSILNSTTTG